jgi:hypothetical protein
VPGVGGQYSDVVQPALRGVLGGQDHVRFTSRGRHQLGGLAEEWPLFAVTGV